jgi:malonyl CoA-acyl carrier protein transacylase
VHESRPDIVAGDGLGDLAADVLDVLWSDTARALEAAGAARFVESGSSRVLGDLVCETLLGPQDAEPELAHA